MGAQNTLHPQATQAPVAATPAVATLPAVPGLQWALYSVAWSYSAAPTGGSLTIAWSEGASNYQEVYAITAAGKDQLSWGTQPKRFPANTQVTITLASGAGGVIGTVYPWAMTE